MANHYNIWVEKYGKEEADRREMARREKLRANGLERSAAKPKKIKPKKEKKSRSGANNSMYGKTVLEAWIRKYGEAEANRRWAERNKNVSEKNKARMASMTPAERSKKYGTFGDDNAAKRPEVKAKIRNSLKEFWDSEKGDSVRKVLSENMLGDNNPSRLPGASERISAQRTKYYEDPANREKTSETTIKQIAAGKSSNGRTKNFTYTNTNGKTYIVQGTYELAFIKWLDNNNMTYRCHEDRISYINPDGTHHNYLPDFYVYEWDMYIDVKSTYRYDIQKMKFDAIFNSNPTLNLKILLEHDLSEMGII
jgi:hypothetical protein